MMLIIRKVAQISWGAGGGKDNEFSQFWPLPEKYSGNGDPGGSWAATPKDMIDKILKAHL
jgi:hypothetical protein